MADPQDMILPLLREIRAEMHVGFDGMRQRFEALDARFDTLDRRIDDLRGAVNGESVLGRYATAAVEKRLESIETRLTALESRA